MKIRLYIWYLAVLVFSWFDTGCEDRKTERTLLPIGEVPADSTVPPNVKSRELFNCFSTSKKLSVDCTYTV